ncbi:PREDICTED: sugar phosphate exchanger 3 [Thamnophis sirtalis]|uniref:Sugar phosphate exchanger 3 n=1 Tax=Thamnophis sirtalis TaxID=35019 RepID=A0A6I9XHS9_9SAUR|nr:PREDICTED: sugar phosphate exchanger 3 [Thamnophis sirtalis]
MALRRRFEDPLADCKPCDRIKVVKQGRQPVEEYIEEFRDLAYHVNWLDDILVNWFRDGLSDELYNACVARGSPTHLHEWYLIAKEAEIDMARNHYSLLHASRKTFSNVKVSISSQWTPSSFNDSAFILQPYELWNSSHLFPNAEEATLFLGTLDTIFLFSYAVVSKFSFFEQFLNFEEIFILNFTFRRGFVFGLWSACASVGNILGAFLASSVLQYGYEYAFLVTSSVQFAGGVIVFFGLVISPKEVGLPEIGTEGEGEAVEEDATEPLISSHENEDFDEQNHTIQASNRSSGTNAPSQAIGFFQACCLPGVLLYSLAYACLKLVNYSFFFWLPFYLSNNFGWKEAEADQLSIWYDVGGIIGGTIQGFISDVLQKRAPVLAISLILAIGSLFGYSRSPNNKPINAVIMAITGFFIGGPSNMISSAISADLGHQDAIKGSSEALATVTGIVDGTGSIGAAVGQYLVSLIQERLGWMQVFYFFILMTSLTVVFIMPLIVKETNMLLSQRRLRRLAG